MGYDVIYNVVILDFSTLRGIGRILTPDIVIL